MIDPKTYLNSNGPITDWFFAEPGSPGPTQLIATYMNGAKVFQKILRITLPCNPARKDYNLRDIIEVASAKALQSIAPWDGIVPGQTFTRVIITLNAGCSHPSIYSGDLTDIDVTLINNGSIEAGYCDSSAALDLSSDLEFFNNGFVRGYGGKGKDGADGADGNNYEYDEQSYKKQFSETCKEGPPGNSAYYWGAPVYGDGSPDPSRVSFALWDGNIRDNLPYDREDVSMPEAGGDNGKVYKHKHFPEGKKQCPGRVGWYYHHRIYIHDGYDHIIKAGGIGGDGGAGGKGQCYQSPAESGELGQLGTAGDHPPETQGKRGGVGGDGGTWGQAGGPSDTGSPGGAAIVGKSHILNSGWNSGTTQGAVL